MDHKTLMIGIAGGTGSGKTTLVRKLGLRFGDSVSVVCHDWYYRAQNGLSLEERARQNYDCPEAFETDLLVRDLARLRDGQYRLPAVRLYRSQPLGGDRAGVSRKCCRGRGNTHICRPRAARYVRYPHFCGYRCRHTHSAPPFARREGARTKHRFGLLPVCRYGKADARGVCRAIQKIRAPHSTRGR